MFSCILAKRSTIPQTHRRQSFQNRTKVLGIRLGRWNGLLIRLHTSQLAYIWEIQFTELRQRFSHPQSLYYRKSNTKSKGGDTTCVVAPGLPNITGYWDNGTTVAAAGGAFSVWKNGSCENNDYWNGQRCDFNASRSSSIYGASSTVQPPALSFIPQIKFQYFICGTREIAGGCIVSELPQIELLREAAKFKT